MTWASKATRWLCAAISGGLLISAGIPANAAPAKTRDPFIGEWLLSVHSAQGQGVSRDEITVALKISEAGSFYSVALEIPNTSSKENEYGGFSWARFVAQSDKSLKNMTASKAKQKYAGEYLMDIGGRSIAQQNGSVTFAFKAKTGLLCEAGLGCFARGDQSALIKRYTEQQRANAEARAGAEAEARARAQAEVNAQAKSRVEARAKAEADAEAEVGKPRLVIDKTMAISRMQDYETELVVPARSRIEFGVAVEGINLEGSTSGATNAVRVILLDEDGHAEWRKTKYKLSLSSLLGRGVKKNIEMIEGPCPSLLKRDVQGTAGGDCVLDAGSYHIVFYEGAPGFRNVGQPDAISISSFAARLRVSAQIVDRAFIKSRASGKK